MIISLILFVILATSAIGWGRLPSLVYNIFHKRDQQPQAELNAVEVLSSGFLGTILIGILVFLSSLAFGPSLQMALLIAAVGLVLHAVILRSSLISWLWERLTVLMTAAMTSNFSKIAFLCAFLIAFAQIVYSLSFQPHGDSHLYHLRMAEIWMHHGTAGVVLSNIFSGYSLSVEHFYLWLRLIYDHPYQQNALAQLFTLFFGWGLFAACMIALVPVALTHIQKLSLAMLLYQPAISFHLLLPKNDGFFAAAGALAAYGIIKGRPDLFLAAAAVAFVIKPTIAVYFVCLCLGWCVWSALTQPRRDLYQALFQTLLAAVLMVGTWLIFGVSHWMRTGNPLFPFMERVFPSGLAPQSLASIVSEMQPFQPSLLAILSSFYHLLTFHWMIPLAVLGALILGGNYVFTAAPRFSRARAWPHAWFFITSAGYFLMLLISLGPFGGVIEPRHFALALGALFVAATTGIILLGDHWQKPHIATLLLFLAAISTTRIDVRLLKASQALMEPNPTQAFLATKPLLHLNDRLSKVIKPGEHALSLSSTGNTGYFLRNADFFHAQISYPLWKIKGWDELRPQEWDAMLAELDITYVIVDDRDPPLDLSQLGLKEVAELALPPFRTFRRL